MSVIKLTKEQLDMLTAGVVMGINVAKIANENLDGSSKQSVVQGSTDETGSKNPGRSGPDIAALAVELAGELDSITSDRFCEMSHLHWFTLVEPFLRRAALLSVSHENEHRRP